jgi:hypothetical protein
MLLWNVGWLQRNTRRYSSWNRNHQLFRLRDLSWFPLLITKEKSSRIFLNGCNFNTPTYHFFIKTVFQYQPELFSSVRRYELQTPLPARLRGTAVSAHHIGPSSTNRKDLSILFPRQSWDSISPGSSQALSISQHCKSKSVMRRRLWLCAVISCN